MPANCDQCHNQCEQLSLILGIHIFCRLKAKLVLHVESFQVFMSQQLLPQSIYTWMSPAAKLRAATLKRTLINDEDKISFKFVKDQVVLTELTWNASRVIGEVQDLFREEFYQGWFILCQVDLDSKMNLTCQIPPGDTHSKKTMHHFRNFDLKRKGMHNMLKKKPHAAFLGKPDITDFDKNKPKLNSASRLNKYNHKRVYLAHRNKAHGNLIKKPVRRGNAADYSYWLSQEELVHIAEQCHGLHSDGFQFVANSWYNFDSGNFPLTLVIILNENHWVSFVISGKGDTLIAHYADSGEVHHTGGVKSKDHAMSLFPIQGALKMNHSSICFIGTSYDPEKDTNSCVLCALQLVSITRERVVAGHPPKTPLALQRSVRDSNPLEMRQKLAPISQGSGGDSDAVYGHTHKVHALITEDNTRNFLHQNGNIRFKPLVRRSAILEPASKQEELRISQRVHKIRDGDSSINHVDDKTSKEKYWNDYVYLKKDVDHSLGSMNFVSPRVKRSIVLQLPENFEIKKALGGGDCFFDSFLKGLVALQTQPEADNSVKSLRIACREYARKEVKSPNSWLRGALRTEGRDLDEYVPRIEYTSADIASAPDHLNLAAPIWGRPDIEGRILCEKYGVQLHLIEQQEVDGTAMFLHQIVDRLGSKPVENYASEDYNYPYIIHMINTGALHFEPILRKPAVVQSALSEEKFRNFQEADEEKGNDSSLDYEDEGTAEEKLLEIVRSNEPEELKLERIQHVFKNNPKLNIDSKNEKGNTALHIAVRREEREVVAFLLQNEADVGARNNKGKSPIDVAENQQTQIIAQKLKEFLPPTVVGPVSRKGESSMTFSALYKQEPGYKKPETGKHGIAYENELILLWLVQGYRQRYPFRVITDIAEAGKFDDIAFQYKDRNGKDSWKLVQVKNKKAAMPLTKKELKAKKGNRDDFSLEVYLGSYIHDIDRAELFNDGDVEMILYTNRDLELGGDRNPTGLQSILKEQTEIDPFLNQGKRYKFDMDQVPTIGKAFSEMTIDKEKVFIDSTIDGRSVKVFPKSNIGLKAQEFFEHFVLAVNQPDTYEDIRALSKDHIAKEINGEQNVVHVYNAIKEKVESLQMRENEGGKFHTNDDIYSCFKEAKERLLGGIVFEVVDPIVTFAGREEVLKKLHDQIGSAESESVVSQQSAITGFGGVGKTELARKYVQRYRNDYTDWIWLNAESPEESFRKLSKRLWISEKDIDGKDKSTDMIRDEVYNFFARNSNRKPLFVFDDAPDIQGIEEYLPKTSSAARCLITSRSQRWGNTNQLSLDIFTEEESLQLIDKVLGKTAIKEARDLADKLHHFPLALQQAVAFIKEQNRNLRIGRERMTISDYLKTCEEKKKMFSTNSLPYERNDKYRMTTFTTSEIAVQAIQNDPNYGSKAKELLDIMSYFSPQPIRVQTITRSGEDPAKVGGALNLLKTYSMVQPGYKPVLFNIHRLVQEITRTDVEYNGNAQQTLRTALTLLGDDVAEENLDHAMSVWEYAFNYKDLTQSFSGVLNSMIQRLIQQKGYDVVEKFANEALKNLKSVLNEKDPIVLSTMSSLAHTWHTQGKLAEAEELQREELEKHIIVQGLEHADTLTSMNNLGLTLHSQERYMEAEPLQREVLETSKKALGPEHPVTLTSLNNLVLTLQSQGKHTEAEALQREVVETQKKVLGPEHPDTLTSMNNLGLTLQSQKKYTEAEALLREVLETSTKVLGPEHPVALTSMNNLVLTLQSDKKHAEALQRRIVETQKKVLGPEHPVTLTSMNNLGDILQSQGKLKQAEQLRRQVLSKRKKVLGPRHPDTLKSMRSLGSILKNQGKHGEAEELEAGEKKQREKAVRRHFAETFAQLLIPKHPVVLRFGSALASTFQSEGKYRQAEAIQRQVLEKQKELVSPEHTETLTSMKNLGLALQSQQKYTEAEPLQREVVETSKKVLGPEHPDTLSSMNHLARTLDSLGKHDDVERMYHDFLEEHSTSVQDPAIALDILSRLSDAQEKQKKYAESLQTLEKLLKVLPDSHPNIGEVKSKIDKCLARLGHCPLRTKRASNSVCIDSTLTEELTPEERVHAADVLTSTLKMREMNLKKITLYNALKTTNTLILGKKRMKSNHVELLHQAITSLTQAELKTIDPEMRTIVVRLKAALAHGRDIKPIFSEVGVAKKISKATEGMGLAFTAFLVSKHLVNGDLDGLGYDALNLYALPKLGEKITKHIGELANHIDAPVLKSAAPMLGRSVSNLAAFYGLYESIKARINATDMVDKEMADLNIATNSIFIAADIPAAATEIMSSVGIEIGALSEFAGPVGSAVGIAAVIISQFVEAGLEVKKLEEKIALTKREKQTLYWDFFFSREIPDDIKEDIEMKQAFEKYMAHIMEIFPGYDTYFISEPRSLLKQIHEYHCKYLPVRNEITGQTLYHHPDSLSPFCSYFGQTISSSFQIPHITSTSQMASNPDKFSRFFPENIGTYDLVSAPFVQADHLHIKQINETRQDGTMYKYKTQQQGDSLLKEVRYGYQNSIKTISVSLGSKDRLHHGFFMYTHKFGLDADVPSKSVLCYINAQVSFVHFPHGFHPKQSTIIFKGDTLFYRHPHVSSNGTARYYFSNSMKYCRIDSPQANFYYVSSQTFPCHVTTSRNDILVSQSNFSDSQSIGLEVILGSRGQNHLTAVHSKYVDGKGGADTIIAKSATVKGYPGDVVRGTGLMLLPFYIQDIAGISCEGDGHASTLYTFFGHSASSRTISVGSNMKMQTQDGLFVTPVPSSDNNEACIKKLQVIKNVDRPADLDTEIGLLRNISNPNFKLIKQFIGQDTHITISDQSNTVFHADKVSHTFYWEGHSNQSHLYLIKNQPGNIIISQGNGIIDLSDFDLSTTPVHVRLMCNGDVSISSHDLNVSLLSGFRHIKVALGSQGAYYDLLGLHQQCSPDNILVITSEDFDHLASPDGSLSLLRDYCSHSINLHHIGRGVVNASDLLYHYNCFQFRSEQIKFLDVGPSSLLLRSDHEKLLIKDYYKYVHGNWHIALKLQNKIILPEEFMHHANQASAYVYYQPDMHLRTDIYHNQPHHSGKIGIVDLGDFSITNFRIYPRRDKSLAIKAQDWLASEGFIGKVVFKNWGKLSYARKLLFAFNDTVISNCVLGCHPLSFVKLFKANKKALKGIVITQQQTPFTSASSHGNIN